MTKYLIFASPKLYEGRALSDRLKAPNAIPTHIQLLQRREVLEAAQFPKLVLGQVKLLQLGAVRNRRHGSNGVVGHV
jgi:hypothetical protein